ncbi:MAG: TonB-dependent receptor, partial [Myxococcota bacterium]
MTGTYYLRRTAVDPFETIVRARTPRREVAKVELTRKELEKIPGTFGDPIRVIENLPGLARVPGGLGGALIVRGANPADTGIYIDGVEIPLLYHFLGFTSVLPPDILENIQFYPGGFSAKYSRATAGIVDVTTRDLECDRLRINAEIDLLDSAAYACAPVGSWSVAAAIRRSYFDIFIPFILDATITDEDEGRVTASPVYTDYQLKANTVIGDHRITLFTFGSSDDLEFIRTGSTEEVNVDNSFDAYFNRIVAQDRWNIEEDIQLLSSLALGYSRQRFVFESDDIDLDNELDIPITTLDWREELRLNLSDSLDLRVGLDHTFGRAAVTARAPIPSSFREFPRPTFDFTAAQETRQTPVEATQGYWAEAEWKPIEGLSLIPGVRVDRFDFESAQDFRVHPRLAARWQAFGDTTFKAAFGTFARLPDPQFLAEPPIGQPELEAERSVQYIA